MDLLDLGLNVRLAFAFIAPRDAVLQYFFASRGYESRAAHTNLLLLVVPLLDDVFHANILDSCSSYDWQIINDLPDRL